NATVVEVHAPDRVGLLRDVTRVFANEGLDIRHARVVTLGDNVVDTFYLSERDGRLLDDQQRRDNLTHSLLAVLA
ncbi:MAG: ACT domain-containing protein, partial [Actinomycetota bacterium]